MLNINLNEKYKKKVLENILLTSCVKNHAQLIKQYSKNPELLFEKGKRAEFDQHRMNTESSGDGLFIVKKCANVMNGEIKLQILHDRVISSLILSTNYVNANINAKPKLPRT